MDVVAVADAGFDFAYVGDGVGTDHHVWVPPSSAASSAAAGTTRASSDGVGDDGDMHGNARFEALAGVGGLDPDLYGGAIGIDGGADDGDVPGTSSVVPDCFTVAGSPTFRKPA